MNDEGILELRGLSIPPSPARLAAPIPRAAGLQTRVVAHKAQQKSGCAVSAVPALGRANALRLKRLRELGRFGKRTSENAPVPEAQAESAEPFDEVNYTKGAARRRIAQQLAVLRFLRGAASAAPGASGLTCWDVAAGMGQDADKSKAALMGLLKRGLVTSGSGRNLFSMRQYRVIHSTAATVEAARMAMEVGN